jgi:hypothetical protein
MVACDPVARTHVSRAIKEYDRLGPQAFLNTVLLMDIAAVSHLEASGGVGRMDSAWWNTSRGSQRSLTSWRRG